MYTLNGVLINRHSLVAPIHSHACSHCLPIALCAKPKMPLRSLSLLTHALLIHLAWCQLSGCHSQPSSLPCCTFPAGSRLL